MPTIHLLIKGKVQGVFFRASAKKEAERLKVTGWVRNKETGEVEAKATGTEEQLRQFYDWCRKGPAGAIVTAMEEIATEEEHFSGFEIRR